MNRALRKTVQHAVRNLATAVSSASLYSPSHPQVSGLRDAALASLAQVLETCGEFSLMVVDDELVLDGEPLDAALYASRFATMLSSRGVGNIRFSSGLSIDELAALTATLSGASGGGVMNSSEHIRLGRVEVRYATGEGADADSLPRSLDDVSPRKVERFMEIFAGVGRKKRLPAAELADMVGGLVSSLRDQSIPLLALAPLKNFDEYTFTHSVNVCILNLAQAMSLGIDGQQLQDIGIAGMLHDIGKTFVPHEILTKPGKLDDDEWRLMRLHPVKGARCLIETPGVTRLAAVVAYEHHLKHDFSGYPAVPSGWKQNLCSQMTAISDFYDALRTKRAYRGSMEQRQIAGILLENMGKEFHPVLTRNFLILLSRMIN